METRILLAEDNDDLREIMTDYLTDNGYYVDSAADGLSAYTLFQENKYNMVLLDVMMPHMDGYEVCAKIKQQESVPVLFITAKAQEADQLRGFELGADDYIVKPFSLPVLLAKCKVILGRNNTGSFSSENTLSAGGIEVLLDTRQVMVDGEPISMQALDYEMLCYFMNNQGRIFSREQLLLKLWGYDYEGSDRSVDTHIKKLRKQLGKKGKYIKTVIKVGYKFEVD